MISSKVLRAAQHQSLKASQYRNERLKRPTEGEREDVKEKTLKCDCKFQILLQKHYYCANIGRAYHTLCFEHFIGNDANILKTSVQDYLSNWDSNSYFGHGITFNGGLGTGKTFAMSLILKELIKRGHSAYFIGFDELINTFGSSWNNDDAKYLNTKLRSVDILGIDELRTDSRNSNGFLSQVAENIVRHRTVNLLPTLITTNMTPKEEKEVFEKAYSLLSSLNIRIEPQGKDVRGNIVREREFILKQKKERRPVC